MAIIRIVTVVTVMACLALHVGCSPQWLAFRLASGQVFTTVFASYGSVMFKGAQAEKVLRDSIGSEQ